MQMDDIILQRIIAIAGMCLWLVFPIGMFISVVRQDKEATPSKLLQKHQPSFQMDPFDKVKVGDVEKELVEPKMDDFSRRHVSIGPGPDNQHVSM